MFFTCTLKDGIVYVPTTAKTEAGFYMSREPVAVVPAANTEALRRALQDVMDRANPIIPTPKRDAFPTPMLPKYAGARSWSAFMRGASEWSIIEKEVAIESFPIAKIPMAALVGSPIARVRSIFLPGPNAMTSSIV
jgi:hypothetical protein